MVVKVEDFSSPSTKFWPGESENISVHPDFKKEWSETPSFQANTQLWPSHAFTLQHTGINLCSRVIKVSPLLLVEELYRQRDHESKCSPEVQLQLLHSTVTHCCLLRWEPRWCRASSLASLHFILSNCVTFETIPLCAEKWSPVDIRFSVVTASPLVSSRVCTALVFLCNQTILY